MLKQKQIVAGQNAVFELSWDKSSGYELSVSDVPPNSQHKQHNYLLIQDLNRVPYFHVDKIPFYIRDPNNFKQKYGKEVTALQYKPVLPCLLYPSF